MPVGKLMWCQDCHYACNASADAQTGPAGPSAGPSSTGPLPSLPAGMMNCPICSHLISMEAASCPACGHPLDTEIKRAKELKARDAAAIIWLIIAIIWAFFNWPKPVQ